MELLGKLGIDVTLLIAQIVNFGILLLVFTKFVYKPIIKRIEQDETVLKNAEIKSTQLVHTQEKKKQESKEKELRAKKRAEKIIQEAEDIAMQIKTKAKKEADEEKAAIIKQIQSRLEDVSHVKKSEK